MSCFQERNHNAWSQKLCKHRGQETITWLYKSSEAGFTSVNHWEVIAVRLLEAVGVAGPSKAAAQCFVNEKIAIVVN